MYQKFKDSLLNINIQINKGHYVTYSRLYKDLDALAKEIGFAYRYGMLTFSEHMDLEDEIAKTLQFFDSSKPEDDGSFWFPQ